MGYYINTTDLDNAFGSARIIELADKDLDGVADAEMVADAIENAESTVEMYVGRRYDLADVRTKKPKVVIKLSLDLGLYELAKARDEALVGEGTDFKEIHDTAIAMLKDLARGNAVLDVTSAIAEPTVVEIDANDRLFTRTTMKGF
ncbi:MAG TPA: phage protein Gp36 family protein [Acidobacteriota bacterium]|nr:phage protein Gp36 family protein [Acidobacteriota bacterium]